MRLVVDALAARFGGTAAMAAQVSRALARREDVEEVSVLSEPGSVLPTHVDQTPGLRSMLISTPNRGRLLARLLWEATRLPPLLDRLDATALLTFSGMLPRDPRLPVVSMLLNALPFDRVDPANRLRRLAIKRTSRRAHAVIVPTHYMAQFLGDHPNLVVMPYGVDQRIFIPAHTPGDEILYVSDFYEHKRHDLVIRAWNCLPEPRPRLRLIGNATVDPTVFERVAELAEGSGPGIVVGGEHVPLTSLVQAYRRARIVVMPSENESFSMPLAEAARMGVPCVARDHPVLRETAGPGGVYVSGDDESDWAGAMERLLSDDCVHARLRSAALEYSTRYSWDALAAAIIERLASGRAVP
jgi:glycosyltransferase involved in cell wall biosynthesis